MVAQLVIAAMAGDEEAISKLGWKEEA